MVVQLKNAFEICESLFFLIFWGVGLERGPGLELQNVRLIKRSCRGWRGNSTTLSNKKFALTLDIKTPTFSNPKF